MLFRQSPATTEVVEAVEEEVVVEGTVEGTVEGPEEEVVVVEGAEDCRHHPAVVVVVLEITGSSTSPLVHLLLHPVLEVTQLLPLPLLLPQWRR